MNKKIIFGKRNLSFALVTALALTLALALTACSALEDFTSESEDVKICLPAESLDKNGNVTPVELWSLSYTDGINSEEIADLPAGSSIQVQVCKNKTVAFLAQPLLSSSRKSEGFVYPTGAIFPYNKELCFENGFAASVLLSLYKGSTERDEKKVQDFLCRFNWQKFEEVCLEKAANPWLLDKERIMKAISSGKFKKSDVCVARTVLSGTMSELRSKEPSY